MPLGHTSGRPRGDVWNNIHCYEYPDGTVGVELRQVDDGGQYALDDGLIRMLTVNVRGEDAILTLLVGLSEALLRARDRRMDRIERIMREVSEPSALDPAPE